MTIDEQVNFLKNEKKLKFKSEKLAKRVLQEVGYYKLINAYKIPFIINNQYLDKVYFEDIYNLYKFDTELKTIVFEAATNIEINFKSLLSEVISSQYGIKEKIYLKKENWSFFNKYLLIFLNSWYNKYTFGSFNLPVNVN
mgnify:FL=1